MNARENDSIIESIHGNTRFRVVQHREIKMVDNQKVYPTEIFRFQFARNNNFSRSEINEFKRNVLKKFHSLKNRYDIEYELILAPNNKNLLSTVKENMPDTIQDINELTNDIKILSIYSDSTETEDLNNNYFCNMFYINLICRFKGGDAHKSIVYTEDNKFKNLTGFCFWLCLLDCGLFKDVLSMVKFVENHKTLNQAGTVFPINIPFIEDELKINIHIKNNSSIKFLNCRNKYNKTVNLIFENNHYKINNCNTEKMPVMFYFHKQELKPRIYNIINNKYYYYDGVNMLITDEKNKDKEYFNIKYNIYSDLIKEEENKENNIKKLYLEYNKQIEEIKNTCKQLKIYPEINLNKTRDISNTIINMVYMNTKKLSLDDMVDYIDYEDYNIIEKSTKGGFVFCQPGEYNIYSYDYVKSFPSVLLNKKLFIPIKKFVWSTITEKNFLLNIRGNKLCYGFYKCCISPPDDEKFNLLGNKNYWFTYNKNNSYTNFAIELAYIQGLNIKLIQEENNYIKILKKDCLKGREVFGKLIENLNLINECIPDNKILKKLFSGCWGSQCALNKKTIVLDDSIIDFETENNENLLDVMPRCSDTENNKTCVKMLNNNTPFKTYWARFKPFMFDLQKLTVYNDIIKKYLDTNKIVKFRIDGFWTTERIMEFDLNKKEIGKIIYKKKESGKYIIKNINNIKKIL